MSASIHRMRGWQMVLFNASLALNCMLLFLLVFEERLALPAWLQVVGRMHPLLLHFPLVLIIVYALLVVFVRDEAYKSLASSVLLVAAFTSVLTAIMGLFLSREQGYDAGALLWHKWGGVAISLFSLLWYWFQQRLLARRAVTFFTSIIALLLVIVTGHLGAAITHGEDFLLAPVSNAGNQSMVAFEDAEVYKHMVMPVLERKCISCHNSGKAKGELVMETEALLLKGGKNGKLWDAAAANLGLMLQRIHLPLAQKEHMPPKNKPQLTEEEIQILEQWIRKGSNFKLRVAGLPETDTLYRLALKSFTTEDAVVYNFAAPDAAVVNKLNTANRVVSFVAMGSPALAVGFFNGSLFNSAQLTELKEVKKQVVSMNLARMPITDVDLRAIGEFENLRQLNLSFTGISGNGLKELRKLKFLQRLSLSGTKLTAPQLAQLKTFPSLKTLYIWNTPIAEQEVETLRQKLAFIKVETGAKNDTVVLKLSPPVAMNEDRLISGAAMPLKLKHYIQGVEIRYTMDGSEPDSIHSAVFKGNETLNDNTVIKARAYKPGWISSDLLEISFFKNTYTPDSVIYLTQPNEKYRDERRKLLIDHEQGLADFRSGTWVAFRENRMECLLVFSNPVNVQSIGLSSLVDVGSYIMPPASVQVWGAQDANQLKLIAQLIPQQPAKQVPATTKNFECRFKPVMVKYIKLVANPVGKLPAWHPGKGDKAWVFVDEVLVN